MATPSMPMNYDAVDSCAYRNVTATHRSANCDWLTLRLRWDKRTVWIETCTNRTETALDTNVAVSFALRHDDCVDSTATTASLAIWFVAALNLNCFLPWSMRFYCARATASSYVAVDVFDFSVRCVSIWFVLFFFTSFKSIKSLLIAICYFRHNEMENHKIEMDLFFSLNKSIAVNLSIDISDGASWRLHADLENTCMQSGTCPFELRCFEISHWHRDDATKLWCDRLKWISPPVITADLIAKINFY